MLVWDESRFARQDKGQPIEPKIAAGTIGIATASTQIRGERQEHRTKMYDDQSEPFRNSCNKPSLTSRRLVGFQCSYNCPTRREGLGLAFVAVGLGIIAVTVYIIISSNESGNGA